MGMDYWKRLFEGMTGEDDLERLFRECGVFLRRCDEW